MNHMKRALSVLMICCLLLGIVPTPAFAGNAAPEHELTVNLYRSGPSATAELAVQLSGENGQPLLPPGIRKPF